MLLSPANMAAMFRWRTLYLADTTLEIMSLIGSVILVGVVVNNAILMIEFSQWLVCSRKWPYDALVEAGAHCFRPVLVTTFTVVLGLYLWPWATPRWCRHRLRAAGSGDDRWLTGKEEE